MKIVIRMDDIAPNMDMGKFRRFKRLLDEYKIQPLIGVIPENKDEKLMIDTEEDSSGSEKDEMEKEDNPGFWLNCLDHI